MVPKLLNLEHKQHRMDIAQEMLKTFNDKLDLLKKVITASELWVYGYDIAIKAQSSHWKRPEEPRLKKLHQVRSNVKVLFTVFFDCNGMVHHEFLPLDRTVNKEYCHGVMCRLREAICQKRTELWKNQSWILQHDNSSMLVQEFLVRKQNRNHASICVFPLPKTRDTFERKAFYYD